VLLNVEVETTLAEGQFVVLSATAEVEQLGGR
jgi:hypothetical protein